MQTLTIQVPNTLALDVKEAAMLLGDYEITVVDLTEEELLSDAQNAARYHR